jgi:hypothetical protein
MDAMLGENLDFFGLNPKVLDPPFVLLDDIPAQIREEQDSHGVIAEHEAVPIVRLRLPPEPAAVLLGQTRSLLPHDFETVP